MGGCGWEGRGRWWWGWMKERPAAPCLIRLSRQGQDFLSGSAVLPATADSSIQAHNVPVSPDNTSCLCWLQPLQGYTIFHSSQQWSVCLHPPYGYYGPQYWHTSLIIQRAERGRRGTWKASVGRFSVCHVRVHSDYTYTSVCTNKSSFSIKLPGTQSIYYKMLLIFNTTRHVNNFP